MEAFVKDHANGCECKMDWRLGWSGCYMPHNMTMWQKLKNLLPYVIKPVRISCGESGAANPSYTMHSTKAVKCFDFI